MSDTIQIAGEEVEIHALPVQRVQEWRKRARPIVELQDRIVEGLRVATDERDTEQVKALNLDFEAMVDEHLSTMMDLVLEYLPDQTHRDDIAGRIAVEEVIAAFFPLARKAYSPSADFFMAMWYEISQAGLESSPTGTNSAAASGESGATS